MFNTPEADETVTLKRKDYEDLLRDANAMRANIRAWKEAWHEQREIIGRLGLERLHTRLRAKGNG